MENLTTFLWIIFVIEAIFGIGPPFLVLYLEHRLAKKMLREANRIRKETIEAADQIEKKTDKAVKDLKFLQIHGKNEIKTAIAGVSTQPIKVSLDPAQMDGFKKEISEHICNVIDSKLGAETRYLAESVQNDPRVQQLIQQGDPRGSMITTVVDKMLDRFLGD